MHRREVKKFASRAFEQGLTLVPLKMYFKEGRAKVLMGICKGRKTVRQARSAQEEDDAARHQPRPAARMIEVTTACECDDPFHSRTGSGT